MAGQKNTSCNKVYPSLQESKDRENGHAGQVMKWFLFMDLLISQHIYPGETKSKDQG